MEKIKIVHISDLHFGSSPWLGSHYEALASDLVRNIADRNPDLILCTGDLVNGPLTIRGFRCAKRFFNDVKVSCKDVPIKFVPGNHDYAIWGMWGIKKLLRRRFDRFVTNSFGPDAFLRPNIPCKMAHVALFGFDSNPNSPSFLGARGEVSHSELVQLAAGVNGLSAVHGPAEFVKIAALHHHPMPIPQAGGDYNISMRNAGIVLHQLAQNRIDLVLHGHRHFPHSSELRFLLGNSEHRLVILGIGSATQQRRNVHPGNMYNLVTIWSDGSIECESFFAQGTPTFIERIDNVTECRTVLHAARGAFEAASTFMGFTVRQLTANVAITPFGDAKCHFDLVGIKTTRDRFDELSFKQSSTFGQFGPVRISSPHLPALQSKTSDSVAYEPDGRVLHKIQSDIFFGQSLGKVSDSVDISLDFTLNAAFALNRQEQIDRQQPEDRWGIEWVRIPIDYAIESLVIKAVSQIRDVKFRDARVAIFDKNGERLSRLEERSEIGIDIEEERITIFIRRPRLGSVYELRWSLPKIVQEEEEDRQYVGDGAVICDRLLEQEPSRLTSLLLPHINKIVEEYHNTFSSSTTGEEVLEISIFVFDEHKYRLRLIAGPFDDTHQIWKWEGFKPGVGLAGRAFRSQKAVHYSEWRAQDSDEIYVSPDCAIVRGLSLRKHSALICCPLLGKMRIGVLSIGTFHRASKLHRLFHESDEFVKWLGQISLDTVDEFIKIIKERV